MHYTYLYYMCQDPALRPKASVLLQHTFLAQAALQYHEQQCINSNSVTNTTQQLPAVGQLDEQNNDDCDEDLNGGTDTARQELDDVSTCSICVIKRFTLRIARTALLSSGTLLCCINCLLCCMSVLQSVSTSEFYGVGVTHACRLCLLTQLTDIVYEYYSKAQQQQLLSTHANTYSSSSISKNNVDTQAQAFSVPVLQSHHMHALAKQLGVPYILVKRLVSACKPIQTHYACVCCPHSILHNRLFAQLCCSRHSKCTITLSNEIVIELHLFVCRCCCRKLNMALARLQTHQP
jgi:hypothetical protein